MTVAELRERLAALGTEFDKQEVVLDVVADEIRFLFELIWLENESGAIRLVAGDEVGDISTW